MWGDLESVIEWSNSEYYILINICGNLEKWYRWFHLQSRSKDTDIASGRVDTVVGIREGGTNWDIRIDTQTHTYILPHVKQTASGSMI